jgi:phosphatidylglycerophosphatase A
LVRKLIVTGLGTGYLPVAPGTWGSAAAAGVFLLLAWLSGGSAAVVGGAMLALAAAATIGCAALGEFAEKAFGGKDPRRCSLDEWAGQALTFFLLPLGGGLRDLLVVAAAGFVAFRLFDIIKPPPARGAQRLPAGWGIVADDLVAAVYANLACQLLLRLGLGL